MRGATVVEEVVVESLVIISELSVLCSVVLFDVVVEIEVSEGIGTGEDARWFTTKYPATPTNITIAIITIIFINPF